MSDQFEQSILLINNEMALRLECVKIASKCYFGTSAINLCQYAQTIYDWVVTGEDPLIEYVSDENP